MRRNNDPRQLLIGFLQTINRLDLGPSDIPDFGEGFTDIRDINRTADKLWTNMNKGK